MLPPFVLILGRVLTVVLLIEVGVVAKRSPRHVPLAIWLALTLLYSLSNFVVFAPQFSHSPRPYAGAMRLLLHVAHAIYITQFVAFVLAIFSLIRPWKIYSVLAVFFGLSTLGMLIVGYGRAPEIGLYRVGGLVFASERAFVAMRVLLDLLLGLVVLPRIVPIVQDLRGTDEEAAFFAAFALEMGGILAAVVVSRYNDTPVAYGIGLAASAVAIGVYVPVVYLHLQGERNAKFVFRQVVSQRRYALYEMGERVARSREALVTWEPGNEPSLDEFPTVRDVTRHNGRAQEIIRVALIDRTLAVAIELVLSVAWSMGPKRADRFLGDALEIVAPLVVNGVLDRDGEFLPVAVMRSDLAKKRTGLMAPLYFALFSMLRGMETTEAIDALERARSLIAGAR